MPEQHHKEERMRMRRLWIIAGFLVCVAGIAGATDLSDFAGDWRGEVQIDGKQNTMSLRIEIDDTTVYQYFADSKGRWSVVEPDVENWDCMGDNLLYFWINTGGIWSETQVFSLTRIDSSTLSIRWTRHVNNRARGSSGEDWFLVGGGKLRK
jgi:hypothetical protein